MGYGAILGQAADAFTKTQTLTSSTSALFGKDGAAVPNDIFKTLSNSVLLQNIQTLLPSTNSWYSVTYGNGKFVAVSGTSSVVAYSEDGISWASSTLPSPISCRSVTYGNGKFVIIADGTNVMAYSEDGINWTSSLLPTSNSWQSVTYGNGKFVAVAGAARTAAYSEDGINWTASTLPSPIYYRSVTYGNGKFVAVSGNSGIGAYSEDGINWTSSALSSPDRWESVTYGNGKFVAVTGTSSVVAYSEDGINWTNSTLPSSKDWYSVTYGNGKFVAVAYNSNATAYSTDGINWNSEGPTISYPDGTPLYNAMMSILGLPGVQIATGSYVGTGKYGADNPNSLTFNFSPKAIIIIPSSNNGWRNDGNLGVFVYGAQYPSMSFDGTGQGGSSVVNGVNTVTGWGSNTIRWNNNQYSNRQLNYSGYTYFYIAFG